MTRSVATLLVRDAGRHYRTAAYFVLGAALLVLACLGSGCGSARAKPDAPIVPVSLDYLLGWAFANPISALFIVAAVGFAWRLTGSSK
jgi:hypothetical protein